MTSQALRKFRLFVWGLAAAAAAAGLWLATRPQPSLQPVRQIAVVDEIGRGDYALTAHDGSAFTAQSLRGQPSLVFFGFTHCPDVCPTTLGDIEGWREALGAEAEDLRVYFVTVDPERDTAEALRDYVGWLPGALGVTGSLDEIVKAAAAFRIYAAKVPQDDGGYTLDHSSYVLFFDREGRFNQHFSYQEDAEGVVAKLRAALKG